MPPLLVLGLRPMWATWWALLILPALRSVTFGLLVPLLFRGLLPGLRTRRFAAALLLPSCCRLGVLLLLPGKSPEVFGTLVAFPVAGAISCGGIVCLVTGDALLRLVGQTADTAPDGVNTSSMEVVEALALVPPHRFSLVGTTQ